MVDQACTVGRELTTSSPCVAETPIVEVMHRRLVAFHVSSVHIFQPTNCVAHFPILTRIEIGACRCLAHAFGARALGGF